MGDRTILNQRAKDYFYGKRSLGKPRSWRTVRGIVQRFGTVRRQIKGGAEVLQKTVLLKDIRTLDNRFQVDHLWISWQDSWPVLKPGMSVQFTGQVWEYTKLDPFAGGFRQNYNFSDIRDFQVIS